MPQRQCLRPDWGSAESFLTAATLCALLTSTILFTKMRFMIMFISELKMQKNKLTYMNLLALMALTGYLMLEKHCTEEINTAEFPNPSIIREISPS